MDGHGQGTNGLLCSPTDLLPFAFGVDSLRKHRRAAVRQGVTAREVHSPSIALDIDTAADLDLWAAA